MTRFLLIFTLLTLAVPTTTEPPDQPSGTITTPDLNGSKPEFGTTTTQPTTPSLGTTEAIGTDAKLVSGSTVPAIIDGPVTKRANLAKCKVGLLCLVGSNCIDGAGNGKHTNFTMIDYYMKLKYWTKEYESSLRIIEKCNLGVTLKAMEQKGVYELEYHTTADYLNLPLVIETMVADRTITVVNGDLICSPACQVFDQSKSVSGKAHYWSAKIKFHIIVKRANLEYCHNKPSICFVLHRCLIDRENEVKKNLIVWVAQKRLKSFSPNEKNVMLECDVGVLLVPIAGQRETFKIEYHTTSDNAQLSFTRYTPGPPRVARRISIKSGAIQCQPECEFNRTKGESDQYFWSGEIRFMNISVDEAKEYERLNPIANKAANGEKDEDGSSLALILGICAAVLVVGIVAVVVVVKVIERRQEKENQRRRAAITAKVDRMNKSREGVTRPKEVAPLIPDASSKIESDLVSESAKNKSGRDDEF